MHKKVYIPDRFSEPMTPELLAELEAYKKIYEVEVEHIDFKHEAYASAYELITKIEANHEP